MLRRKQQRRGRLVAIGAGIGAALGGLAFWRKRRSRKRSEPASGAEQPNGGEHQAGSEQPESRA